MKRQAKFKYQKILTKYKNLIIDYPEPVANSIIINDLLFFAVMEIMDSKKHDEQINIPDTIALVYKELATANKGRENKK